MKIKTDENETGIMRLVEKYLNNFCNAKKEIRNIMSNKIIKPILPGLDFVNLRLLANNEFLIEFFIFIEVC